MNILITGINGFVGKYLAEELRSKKHSVFGIDITSSNGSIFSADICDETGLSDIIKNVRPDIIYHLAAIANVDYKNPSSIYNVNINGTKSLLSTMLSLDPVPKLVFISSSQVYGQVPESDLPITEKFEVAPVNHYGASKAACELLVRGYGYEYGLQYVIFRPFNHTGPGQTDKFVIPKIVNAFKTKAEKVELGNIDVIRDFSDVRDVVSGYSSVLNRFDSGEIFNIASGKGISIREIVRRMCILSKHDIRINEKSMLKRSNEISAVIGDNRKLSEKMSWSQRFDIETTLSDMLNKNQ